MGTAPSRDADPQERAVAKDHLPSFFFVPDMSLLAKQSYLLENYGLQQGKLLTHITPNTQRVGKHARQV